MPYEQWLDQLTHELARVLGMSEEEAATMIEDCGDDSWRDAYDDGLTPREAADEEAHAAAWMGA